MINEFDYVDKNFPSFDPTCEHIVIHNVLMQFTLGLNNIDQLTLDCKAIIIQNLTINFIS